MNLLFDSLLLDTLLVTTMFEDTIKPSMAARRTVIERALVNNPEVNVGIA
jgi:hypothetical protein